METKCNLKDCTNNSNQNIISYVHKWQEYGGYSQYEYPRFFCSHECLNDYEKNHKCNYCGIVCYDWREYKKGIDGFTYCDSINDISVGSDTCYNHVYLNNQLGLNK